MTANSYYETHITMIGDPQEIKPVVEMLKWKFSVIDGDPSLGNGVRCYATKHWKSTRNQEDCLVDLRLMAESLEYACRTCKVIRRKIELVIYDDRSRTVTFECNGACPECHLEDCSMVGRDLSGTRN